MTFDPNTPLPTSSPKGSVVSIKNDFNQFAAIFSRTVLGIVYNHYALNDRHQGQHAAVILENQTADPVITQDLTVLYNKNATSALSTEPQIFLRIPQFLPTDLDTMPAINEPMQLTYNKVSLTAPIYQSFLAGGYLIYFGSSPLNVPISLIPTPSQVLTAGSSPNGTSNVGLESNVPFDVGVIITQPDKITLHSSRGSGNFLWWAIAKA